MPRARRPYHLILDAAARQDLKDIFDYIRGRAGPVVAEGFVTRLYRHCASLTHTPERGTRRHELRPGLRTIGYRRRATIVFQVKHAQRRIVVLGIYYGGRNYPDDFADAED